MPDVLLRRLSDNRKFDPSWTIAEAVFSDNPVFTLKITGDFSPPDRRQKCQKNRSKSGFNLIRYDWEGVLSSTERRSCAWFVKPAGVGALKLCWLKNNAPGWIPAVNHQGSKLPSLYSKWNCFYFDLAASSSMPANKRSRSARENKRPASTTL